MTGTVAVTSTSYAFRCLRRELAEVNRGNRSPIGSQVQHFENWCITNGKPVQQMLGIAERLFRQASGWAHKAFSHYLDGVHFSSPDEYEVTKELFDAFGEKYIDVTDGQLGVMPSQDLLMIKEE
ncbi:hypothetical protein HKX48_001131 [Thoreauomyces humboldtii]|nr:hypothetical protein HKX48_001131 [Thoreauomyces humboldtii]